MESGHPKDAKIPKSVSPEIPLARYDIKAILVSIDQTSSFKLRQFCGSDEWAPVYLYEASVIFVRLSTENGPLIRRLRINCNNITLPTAALSLETWEAAAFTLEELKRYPEALAAIQKALAIKPGSATSHLVAGELMAMTGHWSEAEQEYRQAAAILPDSGNEMALAGIYQRQGRTAEEIDALQRSIDLAWGFRPVMQLQLLADAEMRAGHPHEALKAVDRAIALLPPPAPDVFTRKRQAILHAIAKENLAGFGTGLR